MKAKELKTKIYHAHSLIFSLLVAVSVAISLPFDMSVSVSLVACPVTSAFASLTERKATDTNMRHFLIQYKIVHAVCRGNGKPYDCTRDAKGKLCTRPAFTVHQACSVHTTTQP